MQRPEHLGMHHVALLVRDMQKARHFYVNVLGFSIEWEPDADNLYLCSGADNLALHKTSEWSATTTVGPQRLDHIGIIVANAASVGLWEQYLRAHDVKITAATRTHRDGATSCYFEDPEGCSVQVIHHPPIAPALSQLRP